MNALLQAFAETQGWSMVGVAAFAEVAKALEKHEAIFEAWVSRGFQSGMDYLTRMQGDRFHPERRFPGVKSVIVLGAWYGYEQKNCSIENGIVARYAAGRDYHKVLKKKAEALAAWLKGQNPLAECAVSVDSGPQVDRVLAETAGLGFFGKNSCLIDPRKGSFFFIASVLTTLELEASAKPRFPNCGSCTRCIDKCPTGAIKAPGVIDANRCISYLTIENKEGIPPELRAAVGNRLFGCDICQEVCPFNLGRAALQTVAMEGLKARTGVGESLDLGEILALRDDEAFLERFAGTPLMRTKRRGLIRNACVVAGNSGNNALIPALEAVMREEADPMLREHARWAIDCLKKSC